MLLQLMSARCLTLELLPYIQTHPCCVPRLPLWAAGYIYSLYCLKYCRTQSVSYIRMLDKQELPMQRVIPMDIFIEILKQLGPSQEYKHAMVDMHSLRNRTIQSMALVCCDFYLHFFPYLFENVYIYADRAHGYTPSRYARFFESIVRGDQRARTLATYVKTYAIVYFNLAGKSHNFPESQLLEEHLSRYVKAVGFMSTLRELNLFHSSITNDLLHATQALSALNVLRIEGCNVPYPLDTSALRHFATLKTTSVYEKNTSFRDKDGNESESCHQLFRHFCLSHTRYLEIEAVDFSVLDALASLPPMVHLQQLHISYLVIDDNIPAISAALKAMPELTSLQIGRIEYCVDGVPFKHSTKFPPLPMLESIRAQLPVLQAIVPRSLISSVSIAEEDIVFVGPVLYEKDGAFWKPVAEAFKKSQCPMEKRDIPMSFYCNVSFASYFPDLRLLTIRPKHINWFDKNDAADVPFGGQPDEVITTFLGSWGDHPKLTVLEFAYDRGSTPLPAEGEEGGMVRYSVCNVLDDTLTALKLRIPTLQWLRFTVKPPRYGDEESFEFYLGREDELETVTSHSEAPTYNWVLPFM
ncbi:hypothetical protein D9619_010293 [Psilocybe cf. subviscida]|uniref:F-box domain-containing protein n=1 Tax=Psilocybe cf. subviscida TaxID=2480587 RepID=A0A8H5ASM8_9AGAR|nr:hypothetical protein D9619_010293 [Psilocybe cf. subviscida]